MLSVAPEEPATTGFHGAGSPLGSLVPLPSRARGTCTGLQGFSGEWKELSTVGGLGGGQWGRCVLAGSGHVLVVLARAAGIAGGPGEWKWGSQHGLGLLLPYITGKMWVPGQDRTGTQEIS